MGNLVGLSCSHCDFKFVGKYGIGKTDLALSTQNFASEEEKEVGVNFSQYIVDNPHELDFIRDLIRRRRPVILKTWEHQPYYCRTAPDCITALPIISCLKTAIICRILPVWTAAAFWKKWI